MFLRKQVLRVLSRRAWGTSNEYPHVFVEEYFPEDHSTHPPPPLPPPPPPPPTQNEALMYFCTEIRNNYLYTVLF